MTDIDEPQPLTARERRWFKLVICGSLFALVIIAALAGCAVEHNYSHTF